VAALPRSAARLAPLLTSCCVCNRVFNSSLPTACMRSQVTGAATHERRAGGPCTPAPPAHPAPRPPARREKATHSRADNDRVTALWKQEANRAYKLQGQLADLERDCNLARGRSEQLKAELATVTQVRAGGQSLQVACGGGAGTRRKQARLACLACMSRSVAGPLPLQDAANKSSECQQAQLQVHQAKEKLAKLQEVLKQQHERV